MFVSSSVWTSSLGRLSCLCRKRLAMHVSAGVGGVDNSSSSLSNFSGMVGMFPFVVDGLCCRLDDCWQLSTSASNTESVMDPCRHEMYWVPVDGLPVNVYRLVGPESIKDACPSFPSG